MSTKTRTRKPPAKVKAKAEDVPLVLPLPGGGIAKFTAYRDLTPRRTRELEIIGAEILPKMQELAAAQGVQMEDGAVLDTRSVLSGPIAKLSRDEIRTFLEFQEAAAWAYLESWTLERALPEKPDDLQDLPRDIYQAIIEHASKLSVRNKEGMFTVDALPDEEGDEVDPDLPTSA